MSLRQIRQRLEKTMPARIGSRRKRRPARRLGCEPLEPRVVLSATIYTVNATANSTTGPGDSGTLPYVLSLADNDSNPDGTEITFDSSVFRSSSFQTILPGSTLLLSNTAGPMTIDGPGAGVVSISGGGAVGVFEVDSGVTAILSGLTITEGSATTGGGVYNAGHLTFSGCTVSGNTAHYGGGLYNNPVGALTLTDCTVSGNFADYGGSSGRDGYGGGLDNNGGTVTFTGCTVDGNSAGTGTGGGVDNGYYGTVTLSGCTVSGNLSANGGGLANLGTVSLADCTVSDNSSFADGAGLANEGTATLTDCTINGNSAANDGGGTYNYGGTLNFAACTISGNTTNAVGGGVCNSTTTGRVTLTHHTGVATLPA